MIDTMEGREVATADIPGAFLKTSHYKGDIHIKLEVVMAILLEDIDPECYKDFKGLHACRVQEGYLWNTRGITTLLGGYFKKLRRNGISEK